MPSDQSLRSQQNNRFERYADEVGLNDVTIVIPTLNEEMAIGRVIEDIMNEGFMNIFVVDGRSNDNTKKIAEQFGVPIFEQHGIGKTGALKTAIEHVKTPYFVVIDGDMTYDPKDINLFLPHLRHYDEIIGVRKHGRENIRRLNRFGNWLINKVFNTFFGTNLEDVCSGLYALNTEFAKNLILNTNGFDVEVEIAAQAAWGGRISQVPISFRERLGIQKLHPFRDGTKILYTIFKLGRYYNPVLIYSGIIAVTFIPALLLLLWTAMEWVRGIIHVEMGLIGFIFLLFSIQALNLGIVSAQHKRIEQRLLRLSRNQK